jgi:hypothetical protein
MSNAATDARPNTDHVVALVRRWLAESAEHPADPAAERLGHPGQRSAQLQLAQQPQPAYIEHVPHLRSVCRHSPIHQQF